MVSLAKQGPVSPDFRAALDTLSSWCNGNTAVGSFLFRSVRPDQDSANLADFDSFPAARLSEFIPSSLLHTCGSIGLFNKAPPSGESSASTSRKDKENLTSSGVSRFLRDYFLRLC